MVGQPSLIAVGSFLGYVGLIFALGFIFHTGEDIPSFVEAPLASLYMFTMTIFQLSVLPLMVRMYVVLSKNKLAPVSPAVSPSMPFQPARSELDPKLNPRWEP